MRPHRPAVSASLSRGFTLVELVVCIVLAAIVASFIVLFLGAPVQEYFQQTRRTDLIDSADRISHAVTADVRTALPNSLRSVSAGSRKALEFLQTEGTARYYGAGDKNGAYPNAELTMAVADGAFGTLDTFDGSRAAVYSVPFLSAANLGTPGHDAYSNGGVVGTMTPATGMVITVDPAPSVAPFVSGENAITLSSSMAFVADGLPTSVHNAYLVTGPVSYVCDQAAGTLTRYSNYGVTPAQVIAPAGATAALIAHDVSSCVIVSYFKDVPGATSSGYRFGEVAILDVTLSSAGESLQVFIEAPTEYAR